MRALTLLSLLVLAVGCGDDITNVENRMSEEAQLFEGVFNCDNNSFIELQEDSFGRVSFDTGYQLLSSHNQVTDTFATHPLISDRDVQAVFGSLVLRSRNYKYDSSKHDVEEDDTGANINGTKRTDLALTLSEEGFDLKIDIWDAELNKNENNIIASRVFKCKRQK